MACFLENFSSTGIYWTGLCLSCTQSTHLCKFHSSDRPHQCQKPACKAPFMPRTYLCLLFCKVAYKRAGEVSASLAECDKSVEFILHLRSQRFSASEIFGFEFSCNQGDLPMSTGLLNCFWFTRNESEENSFGKVKMTRTGNYQRKITHYWKREKMTNCSWRNIILPTKKHFCTWKTFVSCDEYRCLSTHSVGMIWLHVMYYYPNLGCGTSSQKYTVWKCRCSKLHHFQQ